MTISLQLSNEFRQNFNQPKKHILLIGLGILDDFVGGISAFETNLVRQFIMRDYQVSVLIPRTDPDLPPKVTTVDDITIYRYGRAAGPVANLMSQMGEAQAVMRSILRANKIHLINVHFTLSAWGALQIPEAKAIPKLMHYHGPWPEEWKVQKLDAGQRLGLGGFVINQFQKFIEGSVVRQMDQLVLMSRAFVPYVQKHYKVPDDKINIIPIAWDPIALEPVGMTKGDIRMLLNIPFDRKIVLTARRLVKRTGVDMLIDAMASLIRRNHDLELYIIGTGPEEAALKELAHKNGISNKVRFLGFVSDEQLRHYYRAADLTVMPSRDLEGFGISILESLIQGTPVIGTPVGGIPEVLDKLGKDLVTPVATSHALQKKIQTWLEGNLILPDDATCRSYVTQSFHWDNLFPKLEKVLKKLGV